MCLTLTLPLTIPIAIYPLDSDSDDSDAVPLAKLIPVRVEVGDRVRVFWEGEKQWYKGIVVSVDKTDNTYEVNYDDDGGKYWHGNDMKVRRLR